MDKNNLTSIFDEAKNYWEAAGQHSLIRQYSHWRNEWKDDEEWLAYGRRNLLMFEELCKMVNTDPQKFETFLEWGPGGGANLVVFSERMKKMYGVDISRSNLKECHSQLEHLSYFNFESIVLQDASMSPTFQELHNSIQFILSTAVFQHFPSKEYGISVLSQMWQLLCDSGVALIQIRYDDLSATFSAKTDNYSQNALTFTSYRVEEFWQICEEIGFQPLFIRLLPRTNYAYFYLKK